MSRLMSVAYTEQAVLERRKTVTRRLGWWEDKHGRRLVKPGDTVTLCRKVMGRKHGEPLVRLVDVELLDIRRERLDALTDPLLYLHPEYGRVEMELEGFPEMDPTEFVERFFVAAQSTSPRAMVTRIQWHYLDRIDPYDDDWARRG